MSDEENTPETSKEEATQEAVEKLEEAKQEEKAEEERTEHEPSTDHPRFKKIYAKWKEQERENDANKQAMGEMRNYLHMLEEKVGAVEKKTVEKEVGTTLERLEQQKIEALRSEEFEAVAEIDKQIRSEELKKVRADWEADFTLKEKKQRETEEQRKARESVEEFTRETPWINRTNPDGSANPDFNEDMYAYAMGIEHIIASRSKGLGQKEILKKVRQKTEEKYNKKPAIPTVEGGGGDYVPPGNGKTKLTSAQKAAAYNFFPELSRKDAETRWIKNMQ